MMGLTSAYEKLPNFGDLTPVFWSLVFVDVLLPPSLLWPPPVNPNYSPTPQVPRSSISLHHHEPSRRHASNDSPVSPSDTAPPPYAEVVKASSSWSYPKLLDGTPTPSYLLTLDSPNSRRSLEEAQEACEQRNPLEPTAPHITLSHHTE
ncbi:unnamed protein product [Mesocestoides corti]|uniref:Uncharacterized protein n=1 Tax=Mesocestoides corti TaxID=53468 RepID=A0A0R3UPQ3_MESCO|nr:unnamed protein product [Mesocestoides corti]